MTKVLQQYFPMIRTRMEVLNDIQRREDLSRTFYGWTEKQQNEFLDICTGVKGVKLLYDAFFKEIVNPENTPERLEEFLSLLLGQPVKIQTVLPNDSSRIADESSLLIMDILVQLENGSLANVEVQKIGYAFPGARSACYSADLLLRQYKRAKGKSEKRSCYRDIRKVYTIVLFETSTGEFHAFPDHYIHRFQQCSDTGLRLELFQEYIFIPLDIFRKKQHNKDIENDLDAWLTFLSIDDPEVIERLIRNYPRFIPMYEEVYEMCRNTERVMGLFSKELQTMDKNTVQYMIDEMQDTIDGQKKELAQKDQQLSQNAEQLAKNAEQLAQNAEQLAQNAEQLTQKDSIILEREAEIAELKKLLAQKGI